MKTFTQTLIKNASFALLKCLFIISMLTGFHVYSQTLTAEFETAGYTLTDLGSITDLPSQYGGLTIRPEDPNTLYIGGSANLSSGALYTVSLVRDPENQHITGFGGPAILFVDAPNIDGGVYFAPNGTLLFTRYNMNGLGQILPDNTYVSTALTQYGVSSSVGSLAIVPPGYPGAGNLIFSSYNASILYNVPYTIDASGQYILSNQTAQEDVYATAYGPEGIAYIPAGSLAFPNLSMAISSYSSGKVVVFEVGPDGLPNTATARDMVIGLTGAEGALIDPLTGDFLFSTFGGGNKVVRISGFETPSSVNNHLKKDPDLFKLYPNPTDGLIRLEFGKARSDGTLEISNMIGESILKREFSGHSPYELDLSSLPNGIYIIQVQFDGVYGVQRFVKQ